MLVVDEFNEILEVLFADFIESDASKMEYLFRITDRTSLCTVDNGMLDPLENCGVFLVVCFDRLCVCFVCSRAR